jgi:hypothetical protein
MPKQFLNKTKNLTHELLNICSIHGTHLLTKINTGKYTISIFIELPATNKL